MNEKQTVCLLNDSFPPQIDGVSNAVVNYAKEIEKSGSRAMVVTPSHPEAMDEDYPYRVVRYPSIDFKRMDAYRVGFPFSPSVAAAVKENDVGLLHSHCPVVSTLMARELRRIARIPIVLTYHSKFDIDIANITKNERLREKCKRAMVANISACDEVWVVSQGAGDNLKSLGYEGEYIVMPNGVDFTRERLTPVQIEEKLGAGTCKSYGHTYLFVGRMMWYKGIRIILDALARLNADNKPFRMIFVGDGDDLSEIKEYASSLSLGDKCVFTGAIRDREVLRAWYSISDLFLFPSTYDTNGLVVREAAACNLASVLIKGSCAAEGITDGRNGFLIEENADSLYACLSSLYGAHDKIKSVGECAGKEIYISWERSVGVAIERYKYVMNAYKSGHYPKRKGVAEGLLKANGDLMNLLSRIGRRQDK